MKFLDISDVMEENVGLIIKKKKANGSWLFHELDGISSLQISPSMILFQR